MEFSCKSSIKIEKERLRNPKRNINVNYFVKINKIFFHKNIFKINLTNFLSNE